MDLPKTYEPEKYETDIYALWEKSDAFAPKLDPQAKSFSIVVPPPNANGNLHIGHALTMAIQDIAIRYHRMKGDNTLFVPGADHAGFETQVVYEKRLAKEGKSRFDFSREDLYSQIYDFVGENRQVFNQQFRRLGGSLDWNQFTFTLDEKVITRAYQTFKQLWDDGLVYRGERLVNFCTFHGTAFADVEVEHKEEAGHLWHIRYPLSDGSGELTVATTRPETLFGDTAVAVHPDDERYKSYLGKTVRLPLTNRDIPVIADDFVDTAFGTGAVKITPAHDPNDFEVGQRHDLPKITVIDDTGKLNSEVPDEFRGLTVEAGREAVVAALGDSITRTDDMNHSVGHCYKCGTVIQPLLRDQWFVDMKPLADRAVEALEADAISFYPASKKTQLITYLNNLRDWNISRQIAWGIPIPAFQNVDEPDDWIFDDRVSEAFIKVDGKTYKRDPDVFDTWFSSSSWPYATLDYPDSELFKTFYPLGIMETGGEILYPWVSRMLMLGLYVTDEVPFKSVYIHGYVLAADGAKMSKSLGNVINPLDVIDAYGSDALRMGIVAGRAAAVNRGYDEAKAVGARNFCNKLWNIARYVSEKTGPDPEGDDAIPKSVADEWLLTKLQHYSHSIGLAIDELRFADAYDLLYELVWNEFADWYIEASKAAPNKAMLAYGLETILKLAHPFAPFVTETIWQALNWQPDSLLITQAWPESTAGDEVATETFERIKRLIEKSRAIVSATGAKQPGLVHDEAFITANEALIATLGRFKTVGAGQGGLALTGFTAWLVIEDDVIARYVADLRIKQVEATKAITQLEGRLSNKSYVSNAPDAVVQQTRDQLTEAQAMLETVTDQLAAYDR